MRTCNNSESLSLALTAVIISIICLCQVFRGEPIYASDTNIVDPAIPKRVLILNSYHAGMHFSDDEVRGICENLPPGTEIFIEYMDTKRRHDSSYLEILAQAYHLKYTGKQFDTILSLDDDALNFLFTYADRIFPGIPVVFCGVNDFRPERLATHDRFTGVIETMDIGPSLKIGLQLYPSARQILVITDRSTTGASNRASLERIAASGQLNIPMRFLDDGDGLDLADLISKLKAETMPSLIYYSDFFRDKRGNTLDLETVMPQVAKASPGPVLVHSSMYIGYGALGGKIISGYHQGATAAQLAMRIWDGEAPASLPVVSDDVNKITLDHQVLKRWDIDLSNIPESEEFVIVNKPAPMFQGYGRYLPAALAFIVLESALVLLLLKLLRQQRLLRKEGRQREALLSSILESVPVPFSYAHEDGRILAVNSALTRELGYTLDDVPTVDDWMKRAHPDPEERRKTLERWNNAVRSGTRGPQEYRLTAKDGSGHDMLVSSTRHGKFMIASFFDITERKRQEALLRQSEEKFSRIFQMAPEGVAFMRLSDSIVIDANAAFFRITGNSPAELIGKPAGNLHAWLRKEDEAEYMRRLMNNGVVLDFEFAFQHRDGSQRIALISAQKVSIAGEECAISIMHDLTDVKKMQEMMIQTEKMISVGGIAAGIAHEINNPLGIILQNVQTLALRMDSQFPKNIEIANQIGLDLVKLDAYAEARKLKTFIADIQSAAVRAAGIIRHMLDFSRRSESRRTVCNIETIIDRAIDLASNDFDLKKSFDFKRIHVFKEFAPDIPAISCMDTEIEQVLLNLLRNSAQALGPHPERDPQISISTRKDDRMVYIEVRDNGPGIPQEIQRRIFEPFFTTKGPGVGTGLGLSVSFFIVTKGHDGTMTVDSEPGRGCSFTIGLPLVAAGTVENEDENKAARTAH